VGERRRQIETKLEHLVFRDVQAKLAALLLELGDEYGVDSEDGTQIGLKSTHQEMANLIGSTRETISLTLAQFKKKGLLDLNGRTVVLTDQEGLGAMTWRCLARGRCSRHGWREVVGPTGSRPARYVATHAPLRPHHPRHGTGDRHAAAAADHH